MEDDDLMLTKTVDGNVLKAQAKEAINEFNTESSKADEKEREMWDYVIEKHGRREFDEVYRVLVKYKNDRFSD